MTSICLNKVYTKIAATLEQLKDLLNNCKVLNEQEKKLVKQHMVILKECLTLDDKYFVADALSAAITYQFELYLVLREREKAQMGKIVESIEKNK